MRHHVLVHSRSVRHVGPSRDLSRDRFWARLALALVLCAALACGTSRKSAGTLTVTGAPVGRVEGLVRVVVTFSKPMVASSALRQPVAAPPLKVQPAMSGEAKWIDEHTLVLTAQKTLPVSTRYQVTVPADTASLDGSQLGKASSFEFFTDRLTGSIEPLGSSKHATREPLVRVTFNQDVAFDQLVRHCSFQRKSDKLGVKAGPDNPAGPAKTYILQPTAPLALDSDWQVSCGTELRGVVGNLGTESAVAAEFRTYGPLRFVGLTPEANDIVPDEDLRLELAFSNPLKEPYQLALKPAVPGFPERCYALGGDEPGLSCAVQLEPRTSYTLTIDGKQPDVFGQQLGTAQTLALRTTDAKPTISMESGYFIAELRRPVLPVWTRNVKELEVRVVAITPANFHELRPRLSWWQPEPADLSKTKLVARATRVPVAGVKNQWGQRAIDPAALIGGKAGPGMYYIELGANEVEQAPFSEDGKQKVLVNFTDIGVVSKLSPTRGLVWATQLSTGKPLPGATVTVRDRDGKVTWTGTTDGAGLAVLPGAGKLERDRPRAETPAEDGEAEGQEGEFYDGDGDGPSLRIYVQRGDDWTMVNPTSSGGLSTWAYNVAVDRDTAPVKLRGFMHTDRGLYRAGESVHVKGLARLTRLGAPLEVPPAGQPVKVVVEGPQGKTFVETTAKLSAFGGFWFDLELPGDARLGDYVIRAELEHGTFTREFTVEAYRPATFEVGGVMKATKVVRRGDVKATLSANYFYGAPLRAGAVKVAAHSRPRRVSFDGFPEFAFLDERRYQSYAYNESEHSQTLLTEQQVALDDKGAAAIDVAIGPDDIGGDADVLLRADVTSPSNEVIGKTFTVPYFRSKRYFGIKSPGYFLDLGKPQRFEVVAVSPDGKASAGAAKLTVTRRDWNCVWEEWGYRGGYQCKETSQEVLRKPLTFADNGATSFEFTPTAGGDYWVVVEGERAGDESAAAATQLVAWGDGGGSWRSSDTLSFDIVTDKKEYRAGDTATLVLKTDLAQATGLVTIERDGVLEQRLIEVSAKTKHLQVPITSAFAPNVYVSVALVQGRSGEGQRGKPRMRMGLVNLPVRPQDNTLQVAVSTDAKDYRPGAQVTAKVKVTDEAGRPVAAEVAITAADEGVLSLIGFATPDPVPSFYAPWGLGVTSATQLEYLRDIPGPNLERPATGGDAAGTLRSRFISTAVWMPGVTTDAQGVASVSFTAPDNLTAFRVMAVAADAGYRFGSGDQRFTVSKPLQLHPALPRFLSLGDQLSGGVVVHNETGAAGTATVKLISDARLTVTGVAERTVALAKGAHVPVLFDLTAAELGDATLRFSVAMGPERDALEVKLPVQHPSPLQTVQLAQGSTAKDLAIALTMPKDAVASGAELVVSVDPDGLSGIERGLADLIHYPYGCLEQTTSQVIPMIAMRELAESLAIDGLTGAKLERFVTAGIAKIGRHQTAYGGFSLWPGGEPEAYYTAYALWGLHLAQKAGYRVDVERIRDGLAYLRSDGQNLDAARPYHNEAGNLGSQAFALYVRAVLGDKDPQAATTLLGKPKLPVYGKAFLARALAASTGRKDPAVVKLVDELAAAALVSSKIDALIAEADDFHGYMSSAMRTSAIVLATLVELDPKNAAVRPLVRTLMKHRREQSYFDTQQNLYSLLALSSFAASQSSRGVAAKVALGDTALYDGALAGKRRLRVMTAPMPASGELRLAPRGEVNYSVQVRYRSAPTALTATSNGIALQREYLDEAGKPKSTFRVGDVVVVRVTSTLPVGREHLMVSEPLPAGFEALNTKLATVDAAAVQESEQWSTFRELRDDRVDFASEWTWSDGYVYEFSMRATSVGAFTRPPTVAELMYDPAVNGRASLDRIEIKAR